MLNLMAPFRRIAHRVPVNAFCTEYTAGSDRHSIVIDVAESGLCLWRPFVGDAHRRLQLEFELPDIDEVMWAEGEVRYDKLEQFPVTGGSRTGRTSGVKILHIAEAQRRLLRDYVAYLRNEEGLARDTEWTSYLPGISNPMLRPSS